MRTNFSPIGTTGKMRNQNSYKADIEAIPKLTFGAER
jgi:hypothetical protein